MNASLYPGFQGHVFGTAAPSAPDGHGVSSEERSATGRGELVRSRRRTANG